MRHIYYYTQVPGAFDDLAGIFTGDPRGWLPAPASPSPGGWIVALDAAGVLPAAVERQQVAVQTSAPSRSRELVVREITWQARSVARMFPVLTGELELMRLPEQGCRISLTGAYRPPLSVVGGLADRALGHRVAESCVRRFVLDVADRLAGATLPA